jgi:Skp family chaperone for outer membrane proteins/uncharacterized protein (DUF1499 family)
MSDTIDRLEIQVQTQAQKANAELDKMAGKLKNVASALQSINDSGKVQGLANGVIKLGQAMQTMSNVKTTDFTRLAKNIEKLGNINQSGINSTASALRTISTSLTASTGLTSGASQITDLANSISKLGNKSASSAISNIPLMANALKSLMQTLSTSPRVSQNLINMTNALANLASQGSKVRSAANGINSSLKNYSKATEQATNSTKSFSLSLAGLYAKFWALKRAVNLLWSSVEKSMDFGETVNLFQTSFKKIGVDTATDLGIEMGSAASETFAKSFINRAQDFNNRITEALSLDPELMMNYQAVFAQMANSMGLVADSAMNISESFTLLGNDIASLWNIDTDDAMKKLQSGLAGQIRPLRELGVDISKTSLEMYALKYGISDSVEKMSQAAKVQLRWLAIMEQTEVAFGDMAKTVQSPANQLRILRQQWTNLTRSIGNVFLPVVTTILPYINALVIVLRRLIDTIATAVGFELPNYADTNIYTDITEGIDDIGESANEATGAAEKLKKSLAGFDQLNILSSNSGGSGKGSSVNTGSGYSQLDDAINQKTESYMNKFNEELTNMKNKAEELADKIQPKLEKFIEWMEKISPVLKGIAAAFVTYKVVTWFGDLAKAISAFHLGPAGIIAIAIGAIVAIYEAVKKYNQKLVDEDLASRFGDIVLSLEEVEDIAERITTSKYTANIDIYVTEKQKLSEIEDDIKEDLDTLNKLNWKVEVGLGLTEGEIEQYRSTIEKFISDSEAYMEQQHYVVSLAIDAVIQDDAGFNKEISDLVDEYFKGSKTEMKRLGKDLRAEMDNALADGVLDSKEKEVIGKLIDEINQVTSSVANAEFKATLQSITVDGKLSAKSFKDLTQKVQEAIDTRLKSENEAYFTSLVYINLAYQAKIDEASSEKEKAKLEAEWKADVAKLAEEFSKTKATITFEGMEFAYDTLERNYKDGFDGARDVLGQELKDWLSEDWYDQYINAPVENTVSGMVSDVQLMVEEALSNSGLNSAARQGLDQMLDGLEPTREDLKALYDEALEAGTQVSDGINDQLTSDMTLRALSDNMDGIWFLMGQKLSTDETFLDALSEAENAGKLLNEDFIRGLKSKIPDLKKAGDDLIFDLDKAIKKASSSSGKDNMPGYADKIIKGYKSAFDNDGTAPLSVKGWLDKIAKEIRNYKMPSISTQLLIKASGGDVSDPLGILKPEYKASGGFVNTGQMFVARENGIPEMVGRIGNRTAVANNDQITEGIASAVESAMINVLVPALSGIGSAGNGIIDNRIYLDSNVLYEAMEKVENKKIRQSQTAR